jgi:hypothetical protein
MAFRGQASRYVRQKLAGRSVVGGGKNWLISRNLMELIRGR